MKFNGQSSVEVQPPTNVEDLKTVTSVSLYMRVEPENEPIQDRLVLYLGDRNVRECRGSEAPLGGQNLSLCGGGPASPFGCLPVQMGSSALGGSGLQEH